MHTQVGLVLFLVGAQPAVADTWRPTKQPLVLNWVVPRYPDIATRARVAGGVPVRLQLDGAGRPTDAVCLRRLPLLCEEARQAAREWRFEPSDRPDREAVVEFLFQLMATDAPASDVRSRFLSPSVFAVRTRMAELQVCPSTSPRTSRGVGSRRRARCASWRGLHAKADEGPISVLRNLQPIGAAR